MDSLFANYASSDEGEEEQERNPRGPNSRNSGFIPENPRSSSPLFSLPPPKSSFSHSDPQISTNISHLGLRNEEEDSSSVPTSRSGGRSLVSTSRGAKTSALFSSIPESKSSSVFSSLPPPKSNPLTLPNPASSNPKPRRVVQFKPPIDPSSIKTPVEEEEEGEVRKPAKEFEFLAQAPSVKSFLSSIPAPKNSAALGALPSLGSGRRSMVEADVPASDSNGSKLEDKAGINPNVGGSHENHWADGSSSVSVGVSIASPEAAMIVGNIPGSNSVGENCESHDSYVNYVDYGPHGSDWTGDSSMMMIPDRSGIDESAMMMPRKRGRTEVPTEVIEVKQDELIKNRPREDQVKSTGIAFGPSYQPASTKGKPTKLHKRKHQIGSLYFDMKQKESELVERRSRGFLTKAETQAKYGW